MKLDHIDLSDLKSSSLNVRRHGGKEVDDLVASIRSLGVIQPLLVRPNCEGYEVIAGQRRLLACQILAEEAGTSEPIPCAIMEDGDDAQAIEASLAENAARLPMDELDQYAAFSELVGKGCEVADVAAKFGVTERLVRQRLAIAGLTKPILTLFRKDEISSETLRILTLASKRQQKDWLKCYRDPEAHAPLGQQLKAWLFGGASIPVEHALFGLDDYPGSIVSDLFGEDRYFDDPAKFWECQSKAIAAQRERLLSEGWADVIVLDVGQYFYGYELTRRKKEDGGHVYVSCANDGEIKFHEGFLTKKEASALDRASAAEDGKTDKPVRCELTKAAQNYFALHRHAAVRLELLGSPATALRLIAAHMIAGSSLWRIEPEAQRANSKAIGESLAGCKAQQEFAAKLAEICALLGIERDPDAHLIATSWQREDLTEIFARLLELDDAQVMQVLTFAMAETLAAGAPIVEALGVMLKPDMRNYWQPEDTFFDLLRDKPMLGAMLAELGGKDVASANLSATAKVQKSIIRNFVNGSGGRKKVKGWLPRYLEFPKRSYVRDGGIEAIEDGDVLKEPFAPTA